MTDDSDNPEWLQYLVREFGGHSVAVISFPQRIDSDMSCVTGWHPGNKALTLAALREAVALADAAERQTAAKVARERPTRRSGPIRNTSNGHFYYSAAQAGRILGVSASSIANHLNNPARVPTVAGCILERVKQ